jgi:two-component system, NarL family, nitrate/nitrite response regulator NarL
MPTSRPISIVLVDDHIILLDGVTSLLTNDSAFEVLQSVHSAEEAILAVERYAPDILLTDYSLKGTSGLDLFRLVKANHPKTKVVILTMHDEESVVAPLLKEGVNGYLLKTTPHAELKRALIQVADGFPYVSPEITRMMLNGLTRKEQKTELLTERELQVLKLIGEEKSNREIAEKLFISERTVETHRKNIFRKTNTSSLVGLIKYAFEKQLI